MKASTASQQDGRRLQRMRSLATGLLLLMAIVFIASSLFVARYPLAGFIRAFSEAAMVGACADWFAVVALFRRPLGLPIPHTAIIPRAKDRIGAALGRFIVENFLSPSRLDAKLKEFELGVWGGRWLKQPQNSRVVAAQLVQFGPQLSQGLPNGTLEDLVAAAALAAVKSVPAAPSAAAVLSALWDEGQVQPIIARGAAMLADYLDRHRDVVFATVQGQSWRWLPQFLDKAIADKITSGLIQVLTDVQNPVHPWRLELALLVEEWVERLALDPKLRAEGEALKAQVLSSLQVGRRAHNVWADLERQLIANWSHDSEELTEKLAQVLTALGTWLAEDLVIQRSLNTFARAFVRRVLVPHRHQIGNYVAQVVDSWDAGALVERLELQVGPDLQFIRINGALVGGLVGLILYTFSKFAGLA